MESKLLVLVFLSSVLASEFFVDIENENPLSRFLSEIKHFHFSNFFSRTLCCLTANAQSKCATNCANQDCAATCTVRFNIDDLSNVKTIKSILGAASSTLCAGLTPAPG